MRALSAPLPLHGRTLAASQAERWRCEGGSVKLRGVMWLHTVPVGVVRFGKSLRNATSPSLVTYHNQWPRCVLHLQDRWQRSRPAGSCHGLPATTADLRPSRIAQITGAAAAAGSGPSVDGLHNAGSKQWGAAGEQGGAAAAGRAEHAVHRVSRAHTAGLHTGRGCRR